MNKQTKIGIAVGVIIVLLFAGFYLFDQSKEAGNNFITEVDNHLNDAEKKIYEDRIAAANQELAQPGKNNEEKYSIHMRIGTAQYGLGQLALAKESFNKAIQLTSENFGAYVSLFETQLAMMDNQGALLSIETATQINPVSSDAWRKYLQLKIDRFNASKDEMTALFSEALKKTEPGPGYIDIITFYASWLEKVGELQSAKEYWQKAISTNPANQSIYEAEIKRLDQLMKP